MMINLDNILLTIAKGGRQCEACFQWTTDIFKYDERTLCDACHTKEWRKEADSRHWE